MPIFDSPEYSLKGVYRISSPNGSSYVGATSISFANRWNGHLVDFRLNKTKCSGLFRAFKKYGVDGMSYEVLESIDENKDIWPREKFWWELLKSEGVNLYNGRPTGTGSVHHTEESRRKISKTLSHHTDEALCVFHAEIAEKSLDPDYSLARIAKIYAEKADVGHQAVLSYIKRHKIPFSSRNDFLKEEAIRLYLTGLYSTADIAKIQGRHQPGVYKTLRNSENAEVLGMLKRNKFRSQIGQSPS